MADQVLLELLGCAQVEQVRLEDDQDYLLAHLVPEVLTLQQLAQSVQAQADLDL